MGFQIEQLKQQPKPVDSGFIDNVNQLLKKEILVLKKPFPNKIKEAFYTELGVLLTSGITLKESLELLKDTQKNKKVKELLTQITRQLVAGQSLSEAITSHTSFSAYEVQSLKIGEETGNLTQITMQLGEFYHRKNEQRKQIVNALTYPGIIITTAILVVIFMLNFVVPMFTDIFKQQNVELPAITKFVVGVSNFIGTSGWLLLVIMLSLVGSIPFLNKQPLFKKYKDQILSKVPVFGNLMVKMQLAQFTQAMTLLTASRVPVIESINLVSQMIHFYPLNAALKKVERSILQGESMSQGLKKSPLFDQKMIAMIKVAEETNQTEFMFKRINDQYNAELQQQSKMLSTLLEPFIILFVGLFVGFILIAMYLPMFKLSSIMG